MIRAYRPDDLETIRDEIENELQAAVESGHAAPYPDASEVNKHVYA